MNRRLIAVLLALVMPAVASVAAKAVKGNDAAPMPEDYVWTSPSQNSSESMPCGGGDVGMNVWVEQGDVLFYVSRSGCFDENNTLLKLGRVRLSVSPELDMSRFRQVLHLADGYVEITDGTTSIQLWADVWKPVVHAEVSSSKKLTVAATYESWRAADRAMTKREGNQSSWKFAMPQGIATLHDSIVAGQKAVTFVHRNRRETIFDATVAQQQLDSVKHLLWNPISLLTFGGRMKGDGMVLLDETEGRYASADYRGWMYVTPKSVSRCHVQIAMATGQLSPAEWTAELGRTEQRVRLDADRKASRQWWRQFWQRSYVVSDELRNYTLFRYMLGCNSHGQWPTKFNGGLFTFDPEYVNKDAEYRLSPDFRNWGGGVHTAQNQRLVYWPMLKSGDFDMLKPQLDFYLNIYKTGEVRSQAYWHHGGACLTEQIENYGLPCYAEYGGKRPQGYDPGMQRNAWLEYEWDTCLEFCQIALEANRYSGMDIGEYVPMIYSCLRFFDEHYQYLAARRGVKRLTDKGKLVLYPGSGGETFKGAYNSTSTIAALRTVAQSLYWYELQQAAGGDAVFGDGLPKDASDRMKYLEDLDSRLPDISTRTVDGRQLIAPAVAWERVQNTEPMHLYTVFPWRMYGVGSDSLAMARDTYLYDEYARKFRSHVGWKQDAIWAACLGLTDEAKRLIRLKMADGRHRFPAFWGPGFDWTPDHNWGGSGMIAVQEMLLQERGGKLYVFPAWPREWNVRFRLHASQQTVVEAELRDGRVVSVKVTPQSRQGDVVVSY